MAANLAAKFEQFKPRLRALPTTPGVYLMKDGDGTVIYVGKAINLRNRVRSYFQAPAALPPKTRRLMERMVDFDYLVMPSNDQALIQEGVLIKQLRPRYNVRLKDDKAYPYIKINVNQPWAQVIITRRREDDGARYFGPFPDGRSVRLTLDLLNKLFPYRSCDRVITGKDPRPCLDFHIKRCLGPCIGATTKEAYDEVIQQVILFLEGKHERIIKELRRQMDEAAEQLEFERAAFLRDQIQAVEKTSERRLVFESITGDQDVIALARDNGQACVELFLIRGGRLLSQAAFPLEGTQDEDTTEVMTSFVKQFYADAAEVPPQILLQSEIDEAAVIEEWLRQKRGSKVSLSVPRQGDKKKLVDLAAQNAVTKLEELRARWLAEQVSAGGREAALLALQDALALPSLPQRIECYDISNNQGVSSVGSMVVFERGEPAKKEYRRFRIRSVQGPNDFASLQEVLKRRFGRGLAAQEPSPPAALLTVGEGSEQLLSVGEARAADHEAVELTAMPDGSPSAPSSGGDSVAPSAKTIRGNGADKGQDSWARFPDLIIIDGGKGQLNAVREVMSDLGVEFIPTVGLAKQNEELYLPQTAEPVILPRPSPVFHMVQRIRDEAHRFAITYHRQVHGKRTLRSNLDDVPGVGPKRKKALLAHFGSLDALRQANVDEIAAVPGMTRASAAKLKERL